MNNNDLLGVLRRSFITYLKTNPRSNEKLKVLHGAISTDLQNRIGYDFKVCSLGFGDGHEKAAPGRYMDKMIDIAVLRKGKVVAGLAVKFVMSNYSQNSNNYFENMLGETANLRSNKIPYFQIFLIPDCIPYYNTDKIITKWENISEHNLEKYARLSEDNADMFMHTPNKTFVGIIHLPDCDHNIRNHQQYKFFYINNRERITWSNQECHFGANVIFNDYETFIEKVTHFIKSL